MNNNFSSSLLAGKQTLLTQAKNPTTLKTSHKETLTSQEPDSVSIQFGANKKSGPIKKALTVTTLLTALTAFTSASAGYKPYVELESKQKDQTTLVEEVITQKAKQTIAVTDNIPVLANPKSTLLGVDDIINLANEGNIATTVKGILHKENKYQLFQLKDGNYGVFSAAEKLDRAVDQIVSSNTSGVVKVLDLSFAQREAIIKEALNEDGAQVASLQRIYDELYAQKIENELSIPPNIPMSVIGKLVTNDFITKAAIKMGGDGSAVIALTLKTHPNTDLRVNIGAKPTEALAKMLLANNIELEEPTGEAKSLIDKIAEDHPIATGAVASGLVLFIVFFALEKMRERKMGLGNSQTFRVIDGNKLNVELSDMGGLNEIFLADLKERMTRIRKDNGDYKATSKKIIWKRSIKERFQKLTGQVKATAFQKEQEQFKDEYKNGTLTGRFDYTPSIPYTGDSKIQMLLNGEPGTGKTMLAKAMARELGIPLLALSGGDFNEKFVGVGAARVRELFKKAEEMAPCMVFIDEIEVIGQQRDFSGTNGASQEAGNTLNTLLSFLDGLNTTAGITVVAATNAPIETLDSALIRPGRFEVVDIPAPQTQDQRIDIIEKIILSTERDIKEMDSEWEGPLALLSSTLSETEQASYPKEDIIDVNRLAKLVRGSTAASIAGMIKEAVKVARDEDKERVTMPDLQEGFLRMLYGKPALDKLNDPELYEDRLGAAWHEAGHAIAIKLWNKVTERMGDGPAYEITNYSTIPRGPALGFVMRTSLKKGTQPTLLDQIGDTIISVAGQAMEHVQKKSPLNISPGCRNDWENTIKRWVGFMDSGSIRGFNEVGFRKQGALIEKAELNPEQKTYINNVMETSLAAVREIFESIDEDELKGLIDEAMGLKKELGIGESDEFFNKHLKTVDWDAFAEKIETQIIKPTEARELQVQRDIVNRFVGVNSETAKVADASVKKEPEVTSK